MAKRPTAAPPAPPGDGALARFRRDYDLRTARIKRLRDELDVLKERVKEKKADLEAEIRELLDIDGNPGLFDGLGGGDL